MRRIAWFALKFVALTVPLTWLWVSGGREAYGTVFAAVSDGLYAWVGFEGATVPWRERYIHVVPYLALVLLTPGLGWRRRVAGGVAGLVALFFAQVILNGITQYGQPEAVGLPTGLALLSDALPFLFWAVLARDYVRELVEGVTASHPLRSSSEGEDLS